MAIGPAADFYAPRFLEYERIGRSFPSWNWASLWAPSVWAFYRKLWLPGFAYALWPILAVALFVVVDPFLGDSGVAWIASAALFIWLIPGLVAALFANSLVFRKVRRAVHRAEATTTRAEAAATLLAARAPIALGAAAFLGGGTILFALYVAAPPLQAAYAAHIVRTQVASGLGALEPLQRQIEQMWADSKSLPAAPNYELVSASPGSEFLEAFDLDSTSGRLRVTLGPLIPALSGRSILLAPTLDGRQQVRWICIPVDIPAKYLPQACSR